MSKRATQQQGRRERVAALRREQQQRERRQRSLIFVITGAVLVILAGGIAWAVLQGGGEEESAPTWEVPADTAERAEAVGLNVAAMEGTAKHFHAHLDIIVNGDPVTVPANLGINPSGSAMAELHTHDDTGVLHVEAPTTDKRYYLSQVFAEWDVRLNAKAIGELKADDTKTLSAYVDGERVSGNPADIELLEHSQITLVYGDEGADVDIPDSYDFGDL